MSKEYLYNGLWEKEIGVILLAKEIDQSTLDHTIIYQEESKQWILKKLLQWNPATLNITPSGDLIVIGIDGEFVIKNKNGYIQNKIPNFPTVTNSYRFNNELYICGMSSNIYRYINDNNWELDATGLDESDDFTSISEYLGKLIMVGFNGACFIKNNSIWYEEAIPTNKNLSCVYSKNNLSIITGQEGTLIIANNGIWTTIEHEYTLDDFWGVNFYKGSFYIAGNNIIYKLNKENKVWNIIPKYGWDISEKGIFSDMFYEGKNRERLWVLSEKGLSYLEANKWKKLY